MLFKFSANTTDQFHVLWHDCDAFGVNSANVDVLEKTDQIRFEQGHSGRALIAQVHLEVFTNLPVVIRLPETSSDG